MEIFLGTFETISRHPGTRMGHPWDPKSYKFTTYALEALEKKIYYQKVIQRTQMIH